MEAREPYEGLISDNCGFGKTIYALLIVYYAYFESKARHDPDIEIEYRATLISCPSTVVETWWLEYSKWFSSLLTLQLWFGTSADYKDTV